MWARSTGQTRRSTILRFQIWFAVRSSTARNTHKFMDKFSLGAFVAFRFPVHAGPTFRASGADFGGGRTNHVWVQHVLARVALKTRRGTGVRGFGGWASFARGKAGGQCGGVGKCVLWTILAFGCVQLVGKFSGIAWETKSGAIFVLVPSCWATLTSKINVLVTGKVSWIAVMTKNVRVILCVISSTHII